MTKLQQFFSRRRRAYAATFSGPQADIVLEDLARFCKAEQTPFHENQRLTDVMIGRQEVWLRIKNHLHLSDDEVYSLFTGHPPAPAGKTVSSEDNDEGI